MVAEREEWTGRACFVMAAIGSAVGLGNVWRFPYVCYQNGGGAFLIPYLVALMTAGIPLMILEYGLGHMMQGSAPLSFSKIGRQWEWVGWLSLLVAFVIVSYYAVVMAWALNYLLYSLNLSWGKDTAAFFTEKFLELPKVEVGELGKIRWPIFWALVATWISIYFIIVKGVKRVGRVVMFTVPIPIILLGVLVIKGLTLPGAREGLNFYLTPDFSALLNPRVWLAAYSQIFFSLSLGFGILIAYASYLPRKSDITNNAFITSFTNCATSFFAGFAVFSTLGYLAQSQGKAVEEVVKGGPALAFIVYPEVISLLPVVAQIFGAVFFILLLTLGIDSAFSLVEGGVAGGMDRWGMNRKKITFLVCLLAFLGGIIFTTQGGLIWLDTVDHFITNFGLALAGLATCLVVGYVFGARKLRNYVNEISEFRIGIWWDICIMVITPLVLGVAFVLQIVNRIKVPYEGYPTAVLLKGGWGVLLGVIALSLALSRRWKPLTILIAGIVGIVLLSPALSPSAAFMFVIGFLVLFGGLIHCLHIAIRGKG